MKHFENLRKHIEGLKEDFEKFYDKDNQAAGTRVRNGMQQLKNMAQDIRVDVKSKKEAYHAAKEKQA